MHQENSSQRQFQVLMGEIIIDPKNKTNFQKNIVQNLSIAQREKFDYKHIIFPAKPNIYREHFKNIGVDLTPMFTEDFYHPDVIYPELNVEDYHLHDTHINDTGSFKVISSVLETLGYSRLPEPTFSSAKKNGDLMKMLGKNDLEDVQVINGFLGLSFEPREFTLSAALTSNTGDMKILFNPQALYNRRLILFGDSFFDFSLRVYSSLFSEVIYLRRPYILNDIVKILEPDIVLTANTERYLSSVPDCDKDKPWFMNYLSEKFNGQFLSEENRNAFEAMFSGKDSKLYKRTFGDLLAERSDCIELK